jgi:hypothetical protein
MWAGIKSGDQLHLASGVCEIFVTLDPNLEFQQNIKIRPTAAIYHSAITAWKPIAA